MSEFKLPYVEDLTTNARLPGQLTENFRAIEDEINNLQREIAKLMQQLSKLQAAKENMPDYDLINDTGIMVQENGTSIININ